MKQPFYHISNESGLPKGLIIMTGYITPWENDAATFRNDFKNLEQSYDEIDILLMNLFGGSVVEGIPSYNVIKNSRSKTNTIVEGLAASMGAILALSGNNKKLMAKMSRQMIHRAKSAIYDDFEGLADGSKMTKDYQDDLVNVIVENSNLDKSWIEKNLMVRGKDTFLTAQKCLEYGMIDEIIETKLTKDVPQSILRKKDVKAVFDFYNQQLPDVSNLLTTNKTPLKMDKVIAKLGLPKGASEEEVLAKLAEMEKEKTPEAKKEEGKEDSSVVTELKQKIEKLESDQKIKDEQHSKDRATTLVESAIAQKKILPAQKDHFVKLATSDYDSTKSILDSMQPAGSILGKLNESGKEEKYAGKRFNWLRKNAPAYLENLRKEDNAAYMVLFNARNDKE